MEFLKEFLGEELYAQVEAKLKGNDKVKLANLASGEYISKSKYNDDIKAKDTKISELSETVKKFDGVDVTALQDSVKTWEKKYKEDLAAEKLNNAIELQIASSGCKNSKMLKACLDSSIIKLNDDGTLTGLKEQLENVKKESPFLFETQEPNADKGANVNLGTDHEKGKPNTHVDTLASALADHYGN